MSLPSHLPCVPDTFSVDVAVMRRRRRGSMKGRKLGMMERSSWSVETKFLDLGTNLAQLLLPLLPLWVSEAPFSSLVKSHSMYCLMSSQIPQYNYKIYCIRYVKSVCIISRMNGHSLHCLQRKSKCLSPSLQVCTAPRGPG